MADKADPKLSLMDFQAAAKERPEQFKTGIDFLQHVDSGLGGAERAAIGAAQTATSPTELVDAAKAGFLNPEQAATWKQIAEKAGVENKYGQMAAGALGALTEPSLLGVPGLNMAAKEGKEAKLAWHELAPTLQNLNKEGKLLIKSGVPESAGMALQNAAKLESEMKAASAASKELPQVPNILDFKAHQVKEQAKQFALKAVREELDAHPALKQDSEYLKNRLQDLASFYFKHNK